MENGELKYTRLMNSLKGPVMHKDQKGREKVLYDMSSLPPETKQAIGKFVKSRRAAAVSIGAISDNYLLVFLSLHEALGSYTLDGLTEEDILNWLDFHSKKKKYGWGQNTKYSRWQQGLKVILHWYYEEQERQPPKWFKKFKVQRGGERVTEENLLQRPEVIQLADRMPTLMGKAYVRAAFETNARCSELLALKLEDIKFFDGYARASVPLSKSRRVGQRRELLFLESYPTLLEWLHCHPTGQGFVFSGNGGKTSMSKDNLNRSLKAGARRAGILKVVSSHRLRHAGISDDLIRGLSEIEVSRKTGYSRNSNMVAHYAHLSTSDVTRKEMMLAGMEPRKEQPADLIKCVRCATLNNKTMQFCFRCGEGLTPESRAAVKENRKGEIAELREEVEEMKAMLEILSYKEMHDPLKRQKLIQEATEKRRGI